MIVEFGHFALALALGIALLQTVFPIVGAHTGNLRWITVARPAARAQFVLIAIAYLCLSYAFLTDDFSLTYVATNSNSALPTIYKISAVWGAHEGSLLLWVLMLAAWGLAVSFARGLPEEYLARVIGVMGFVSVGFLAFTLLTSNPFDRVFPVPPDGRDLNPLLQDPGLAIHPPMLYMGYVGFSVAFAFAVAGLLSGRLDAAWARWSRPWTTIAWVFLTAGIALGSWWAYHELGWGGWWFWDPVENASFMPWLVGTALIHSLAVTEKRGAFKAWTVLLAISAFSLSLLGAFLVRSGVLNSVHSFASDPARGQFILMFLVITIGGSLALYSWRAPQIRAHTSFELLSRETLLLLNNVILVVTCAAILFGTLYPIFLEAFGQGNISIGPPFYNVVFSLLMAPLVIALGIGPVIRWQKHQPAELMRALRMPAVVAIAGGALVFIWVEFAWLARSLIVFAALSMTLWVVLSLGLSLWQKLRNHSNVWRALSSLSLGFCGMWLAHFGVAVFLIGAVVTSQFSLEDDFSLKPGETIEMGGYHFTFDGVRKVSGPNYQADQGSITVTRGNATIAILRPEKRVYRVRREPMTESAVEAGLFRDLYTSLGVPLGDGAWLVRFYYKPLQRWVWLGPIFMILGGLLAVGDKRYRKALQKQAAKRAETARQLIPELLAPARSNPA